MEMRWRFRKARHMKYPYFPTTNLQLPTILPFGLQKTRGHVTPHDAFRSWSTSRRTKGGFSVWTGGLRMTGDCFARSARRPVGWMVPWSETATKGHGEVMLVTEYVGS